MTGDSLRHTFVVTNPQGLHMRPMTAFVEVASKYQSAVQLRRPGGPAVNGKSLLALLGLAADQGTELELEVTGPDAREALAALLEALQRTFRDD